MILTISHNLKIVVCIICFHCHFYLNISHTCMDYSVNAVINNILFIFQLKNISYFVCAIWRYNGFEKFTLLGCIYFCILLGKNKDNEVLVLQPIFVVVVVCLDPCLCSVTGLWGGDVPSSVSDCSKPRLCR